MSCVSTPTATQFETITSTSVSTSFSESITTLPDTTSTDFITSCLSSADITLSGSSSVGIGTCVSSTVITSTTVIDGGVSTTQVPFEITNSFTSTVPTNTLFAQCTDDTTSDTTPSTTSSTTSLTTSPTTSPTVSTEFSQTSTTVVVTPTTTLTSSQDTTLSDGQTTQIVVTLTSLLPPTSSVLSSSVPVATTQANDNDGGSSSTLGPIIGGTLGGFAGLLLIVGAIWFFRRRRTNWDDIFEKDYEEYSGNKPLTPGRARMLDLEDEPVRPAEANTEPKPYIYGLVGSKTANPPSLDAGLIPAGNASKASLSSHGRTPSTTPLMNNAAASRPASSGDSNHVSGTNGVSPSPSSAAGGRSGSPGPLGVQIPSGSMFPESGSESPTSVMGSRGPLFIANQLDPISPPGSPRPASPATPTVGASHKRASTGMSNVVSAPLPPSFSGGAPVASSSTATGPPPAAYAYLAEKQRQQLARSDTVSSASVYSQPSRAPTPPPAKALNMASPQRTNPDVVVHTDAGRVAKEPNDQPPAYQD
ncbi:hypothetical protein A7U60_g4791 [Sanghuangporus baumii]|uniref:Uncharacterized protein n=1 Tax=Sanghuangporus baumii TaxID=108892 RepID=A0A9Q5N8Q0_SANBA|nr:hypothetical protein A7U60_g4791 [Sanghuangporus baumii]